MGSWTSFSITLLAVITLLQPQGTFGIEVGSWEGSPAHQITGTISFPNPNTVVIDNFSYDNGGVVVFLYYYRPGQGVDGRSGIILPLPAGQGGGRGDLTRRYSNEQLVVPLPNGLTACDMGALTVWCEPFRATFSRRSISRSLFLNGGEGECQLVGGNTDLPIAPIVDFDNCEPFSETVHVSWTVDTPNMEVDFQICSCRPLDAGLNQYMAFGLSGNPDSTFMIGADATVAWVDNAMGMPNAVDYYNTARVQCRGGQGACPDTMVTINGQNPCSNNVRSDSIVGGIRNNNQQCVLFSRPFNTGDDVCDIPIDPSNMNQYIVWANGGLGETAFIHFNRADPGSPPIHLGRSPLDRCSSTPIMCPTCQPFSGTTMELPEDTTLRVRIGPSGRERGYMGITGQVGWGISWYINDTLVPELVVTRNRTYTFIVEGGTDAANLARYHPFYITSSMSGGRLQNEVGVRASETVYAGFDAMDNATGVGRLCEYFEPEEASTILDTCGTFADYLSVVTGVDPQCDTGEPGMLVWTPDEDTPDEVFYQCATHLNLGWKIRVTGGDEQPTSGAETMSSLLSLSTILLFTLPSLLLGV